MTTLSITSPATPGQQKHIKRLAEDAIQQVFDELNPAKADAQQVIIAGDEFQTGVRAALRELILPQSDLLKVVVPRLIIPGTLRFVAEEHFRVGTSANIHGLDADFTRLFLGNIEDLIEPTEICIRRLRKHSEDSSIVAELGDNAETMLYHMWYLIDQQAKGQPGPLVRNRANVFYIRDRNGVLQVIFVHWSDHFGWDIRISGTATGGLLWQPGEYIVSQNASY